MKGFFGVFNNELFEIQEVTDINLTAKNTSTGVEKGWDPRSKDIFVNINISNVNGSLLSNREMYEKAVKKIEEKKISTITRLGPHYRVLIDYQLYNAKKNIVMDEGIVTRIIPANNAFLPLGLDPEQNELVYRPVKVISAPFEFVYRSDVPFGIMKEPNEDIVLYVNRIQVQQSRICQNDRDLTEKERKDGIVIERRNPNSSVEYKFTDVYLTIYDSEMEGISISPVNMKTCPRKICINLEFLLNNYFFTSDPNDILKYIEKNAADTPLPEPPKPGCEDHDFVLDCGDADDDD